MALSKSVLKELTNMSSDELEETARFISALLTTKKETNIRKARRFVSQNLKVGDIIDKNINCLHEAKVINRKDDMITLEWNEDIDTSAERIKELKKMKKATTKKCVETFLIDNLAVMNIWRNGKKFFDINKFK